ncbi:WD40/YVTN/BNR-like repeat-containing protein [Pseudomonas sp. 11/12A]|uniref:WD40/YVTN/BNR-like repeat-containing protein n=1 Tax=Pseudomonas sp. 11/12A TaxID=1506582 RepID=UPI000AE9A761|nr:hypothetical protein [Pseudomonas sp. 11/12A]
MSVPVIDLLPDPPLPTDPESVFDTKSGASLVAQQAMIPQINASFAWVATQVAMVDGYRVAASGSADAAASSAYAANGFKNAAAAQVGLAADQVGLAANQVTLAVNAKNSAEAAAAAAGSAAGLPSLAGNAYKVLRVTANGLAVEWGLGLPSVTGVAVGKTLVVGAGNTVSWVEKYNIGDTLMSSANPGALWLPADGSIRAQSSYPALFAALGILGSDVGQAWSNISTGSAVASSRVASDELGTVIILNSDGSVSRSTDYGATFTLQPTTRGNTAGLGTDGAGTWIIVTAAIAGTAYRSTDNGLTWNAITLPSTSANGWQKVVYAGNNIWLAIASNTANANIARSVNGGASWAGVAHGLGSVTIAEIGADKNTGVCLFASGTTIRRSTDYGATWATTLTTAAAIAAMANDGAGTWLMSGVNGSTNTYISKNNAFGFTLVSGMAAFGVVSITYANLTFFLQITSNLSYVYADSVFSQVAGLASGTTTGAHAGNGILIAGGFTGQIARSLPYSYDTATQFKLPRPSNPVGLKTYIKALAA